MSDQAAGTAYEADFAAWAAEQAELLRAGRLSELDTLNLADEIEDMGREQRRELENRLAVLLLHLLKWQMQDQLRSRSWTLTIRNQRYDIDRHVASNPSLRLGLEAAISDAWHTALRLAEAETGRMRELMPSACPWTPDQVLGQDFLPN